MTAFQAIERTIGNIEAEVAVIAALLCEPKLIDSIADTLGESDFADPFLGRVYGLIVREHSLGRSLNSITLRPYLEGQREFIDLGGWDWLAGITDAPLSVLVAKESARQIVSFAQRRRLVDGLRETIAMAGNLDQSVESLIANTETAVADARSDGEGSYELSAAECLDQVIDGFDRPVGGVECGNIPSLDHLLGPMRPAHFVVGAGRPGMGKTATAISYALGAAARGHGVLFISLEMRGEELGERMAADLCLDKRILYSDIRDRHLTAEQKREICRARAKLAEMPLQIVDRSGLTINQMRTLVRRWKRRFEAKGQSLDLVIVDYLQLVRGERKQDRYEVVSEASTTAKELAKEHNLAFFALCQLSRAVEQRQDKRPMLSDLRESGQIEQDADTVLFLLRDEYYLRASEPLENDPRYGEWKQKLMACQGRIEFICAKRRAGVTGSLFGEFLYHYQAVRG